MSGLIVDHRRERAGESGAPQPPPPGVSRCRTSPGATSSSPPGRRRGFWIRRGARSSWRQAHPDATAAHPDRRDPAPVGPAGTPASARESGSGAGSRRRRGCSRRRRSPCARRKPPRAAPAGCSRAPPDRLSGCWSCGCAPRSGRPLQQWRRAPPATVS